VAVVSEALECFGGAGYVEDTGVPMLLRDSQVFPIWEGTTNVLSLDALRAIHGGSSLAAFGKTVRDLAFSITEPRLVEPARLAEQAFSHAARWVATAPDRGHEIVEAGARRFALTLGRALALALLVRQAQWSLETQQDERPLAAALRFARAGVDLIGSEDLSLSELLAMDGPAGPPRTVGPD
jgi:hypothetical protein